MPTNDTGVQLHGIPDTGYVLGVFILFTLLSIAVLNGLLLRCFYRLRGKKFVKNSRFLVTLICSDFIGTLLLIPALLSWFFVPSPDTYTTCALKVVPFWLVYHLRVLSMFAFCLYRVLVILAVTTGSNNLGCKLYVLPVTLALWGISLVVIVVPFLVLGHVDTPLQDCRRAMFPKWVFGYMSVMFDIPVVGMNICFIVLLVWLRKFKAVSVAPITSKMAVTDRGNGIDLAHVMDPKTCNVQNHLPPKRTSPAMCIFCSRPLDTMEIVVHQKQTADKRSSNDKDHVDFGGTDLFSSFSTTVHFQNEALDQETELFGSQTSFRRGNNANPSVVCCNQGNICATKTANSEMTGDAQINDSKSLLVSEIRQFIITMGILIVIYDVTILPLAMELHMATLGTVFVMPRSLNALCCLNVFSNPVIYLVRVHKMRAEMKKLFYDCFCRCACTCFKER